MAGFVCIYYGNTGSSWLLDALAGSPSICVPGFEPIEQWAWNVPAQERLSWLETTLTPPDDRTGDTYQAWLRAVKASPQVEHDPDNLSFLHIGLKMTDLAVTDTAALIDVFDRTGAKVIHLIRTNRLKHALSLYRYHDEDKSQFHGKDHYEPTKVDFSLFRSWLAESERLHGQALDVRQECLGRLGEQRVFLLSYEEFSDEEGKRHTLDRLAEFLDVPSDFADGRYNKATPDSLCDAIANYRAFHLRYRFTKYAEFLD
jgi:hypothetical protein